MNRMRTSDDPDTQRKAFEASWRMAAKAIALQRIDGLKVRCPSCRKLGYAVSKWVQGIRVKPLYVVHTNGDGYFKPCALDDGQAKCVRDAVGLTSRDVLKILRMGRPFVLFSGGSDSLCLLQYVLKLSAKTGIEVTALHADTTAGLPQVERYVKSVCKKLGVRLVVVRPPRDYFELAKRWGIPGVRARWCCETLKIAPIRRYLATIEGPKVVLDGIRAAESNLRATYVPVWYHPSFRCISASPIFYWSDKKVDSRVRESGLPLSPSYAMGTSGECWCGAYKCRADFEGLLRVSPEIFDKLVKVEDAQKGRFTFLFEDGKRVPLRAVKKAVAAKRSNP